MKNYILSILFILALVFSKAQLVEDSISMGANYTNDVYYSLSDGIVKEVGGSNWTVSFYNSAMSAAIMINEGRGVQLWKASENTSDFSSITDTAGLSTWTVLHDEDSTWDAFSAFEDAPLGGNSNYGWGEYNFTTHQIAASRVFVIKTIDANFYKVMVVNKVAGTFTYRYASLDNSFDTTMVIYPADMLDRNYAYLNMDNHSLLDIEPDNTTWDFVFNKYATDLGPFFYPVTGVQSNVGTMVAKVAGVALNDADYIGQGFVSDKNEIGYDWKYLINNTPPYILQDSLTFFVKTNNDEIYRVYFTAFEGSSTGKVKFFKELVATVGIKTISSSVNIDAIYPNPSKGLANVLISSDSRENVDLKVFSVVGNLNLQKQVELSTGFNNVVLDLNHLDNGVYLVQISQGKNVQTQKIVVNR